MSELYWLLDEQRARLWRLFGKSPGKPRVNDRRVLNGFLIKRNGRCGYMRCASSSWPSTITGTSVNPSCIAAKTCPRLAISSSSSHARYGKAKPDSPKRAASFPTRSAPCTFAFWPWSSRRASGHCSIPPWAKARVVSVSPSLRIYESIDQKRPSKPPSQPNEPSAYRMDNNDLAACRASLQLSATTNLTT